MYIHKIDTFINNKKIKLLRQVWDSLRNKNLLL